MEPVISSPCYPKDRHLSVSIHAFTPNSFFKDHFNTILPLMLLLRETLTLILLTWRIWWAPNNASKLQMGFNWEFKWLKKYTH